MIYTPVNFPLLLPKQVTQHFDPDIHQGKNALAIGTVVLLYFAHSIYWGKNPGLSQRAKVWIILRNLHPHLGSSPVEGEEGGNG